MFDETKEPFLASDLPKTSSLYGEFQAERAAIQEGKWPESGEGGWDVGFERALAEWIIQHRSHWRKCRQGETQLNRLPTA